MRKVMAAKILLIFLILFIFFIPAMVFAADSYYDAAGFNPNREMMSMAPNENIDTFTGGVNLNYVDARLPGNGGLDLVIERTYNSKIYQDLSSMTLKDDTWMSMGWSLHFGRVLNPFPQQPTDTPIIEMPDGSQHPAYITSDPNTYITKDYWLYRPNYGTGNPPTLTLTDGRTITFGQYGPNLDNNTVPTQYATLIQDAHGNKIKINYASSGSEIISTVVDSLNRTFTFYSQTGYVDGTKLTEISGPGVDIKYTHVQASANGSNAYFTLLTKAQPAAGNPWIYDYVNNASDYNYELHDVTSPEGGTITYQFGTQSFIVSGASISYRALMSRTASGTGINRGTWNFTYQGGYLNGTSNEDATTVSIYDSLTNCSRTVTFYHAGYGYNETFQKVWMTGALLSKSVSSDGLEETTNYNWNYSAPISNDTECDGPNLNYCDTNMGIVVPQLSSKSISRTFNNSTATYTTNYGNYDAWGNPQNITETGNSSRTTSISYWQNINLSANPPTWIVKDKPSYVQVSSTDSHFPGTFETGYQYYGTGDPEIITKYGVRTAYNYDNFGNLNKVTDANGNVTTFGWNWGSISSETITSPAGETAFSLSRGINEDGTIATETDANNNKTSYFYDGNQRLIEKDPPVGNHIHYSYFLDSGNNAFAREETRDNSSFYTEFLYDGFERPTGTVDSLGLRTTIAYKACGPKNYTSSTSGDTTDYDDYGRPTLVTHQDSSQIIYSYNDYTNMERMQEEADQYGNTPVTFLYYDSFGDPDEKLLTQVTDANSNNTYYYYDIIGSLIQINSGVTETAAFYYQRNDGTWQDFLYSEWNPERGWIYYGRDGVGNLAYRTDTDNTDTVNFYYDAANRLIQKTNGPETINYKYDNANNRTNMSSVTGAGTVYSFDYYYDGVNHLTEKDEVIGNTPKYSTLYYYDDNDNLNKISYPSGRKVYYSYNGYNQVTSASWTGIGGFANAITYYSSGANLGLPKSYTYSNGLNNNFTYSSRNFLIGLTTTYGSSPVLNLGYGYDSRGNTTSITDNKNSENNQSFGYDNLNRLTNFNATGLGGWGAGTFSYDALGNRISKSIAGVSTTYNYDTTLNTHLTSTSGGENNTFGYDANGDLTSYNGNTLRYDLLHNMVSYTDINNSPVAQFVYDGDGMRLSKTTSTGTVDYHYDQNGRVLSEYHPDTASNDDYIYLAGKLIAKISAVPPAGSITINNGATVTNSTSVTLSLTCSDSSGCGPMALENDGQNWTNYSSYTGSMPWTLTSGDGSKTVYAAFSDIYGNWSLEYSAVILLDTTSPVTTATPAAGGYNTTQTVSLSCNDGTGSGCAATYYCLGTGCTPATQYTAPISIANTVDLRYYSADVAGNSESVKTSSYIIDRIPPTGGVTIDGGAAYTNSVNANLTITCTDDYYCTQMKFSSDGVNWNSPVPYATSYNWQLISGDGTKTVYAQVEDVGGNWSPVYSASITLDTVLPTGSLTVNGGASITNSTGVTLALTCSDDSGCSKMQFSNDNVTWSSAQAFSNSTSWTLSTGVGAKVVYARFEDVAGNWSMIYNATIMLNTASPTGSMQVDGGATYANSTSATLTFTCSDLIGCSQMQMSNDGVNWSAPQAYADSINWTLPSGDGSKIVYAKFIDALGNWATFHSTIYLDQTAPATVASPPGGAYIQNQSVSLVCNDSGSGCSNTYYCLGTGCSPTTLYPGVIHLNGSATVRYYSVDKAGNTESVETATYVIDTSRPTGSIKVNSGNQYTTSTNVILTLTCSDPDNGGCYQMQFSNDGNNWSAPIAFANSASWTLTPGYGSKTVYVNFLDSAGNSNVLQAPITLYPGLITTATPVTGVYGSGQSVRLSCSPPPPGIQSPGCGGSKIYYCLGTGCSPTTLYSNNITISSSTDLSYYSLDVDNNAAGITTSTYVIGSSTGDIKINSGAAYTNNTSATLTLTCPFTSCSQMQFSNDNATWSTPQAFANTAGWTLTSGEGNKPVYAKFQSTGGSWSGTYAAIITLDQTAPVTLAPASGVLSGTSNVTLTCSDNYLCAHTYYCLGTGCSPTTLYVNPVTISSSTDMSYYSVDSAGNAEAVKTAAYLVGHDHIQGGVSINSGAQYTNNVNVTLTLQCMDMIDPLLNCTQMQLSSDQQNWTPSMPFTTSMAWTFSPGDGSKSVYVKFLQLDGNWSTPYPASITLDQTAPTTTPSVSAGTYGNSQNVSLSCTDRYSGCASTYYCLGTGCSPTTAYAGAISVASSTDLNYYSVDNAGNAENVKTTSYLIDTGAPVGSILINSGAAYTNSTSVTLSMTCTDPSGCTNMQFSNDNVTWTAAQAFSNSISWTIPTGDGPKTVYAKFQNTGGNWSSAYTATIILDQTAPVTTAYPAAGTYSFPQNVSLTCSDGSSGCSSTYYCLGASCSPTTVYTGSINIAGSTSLSYYSLDNVGNKASVQTGSYVIQ